MRNKMILVKNMDALKELLIFNEALRLKPYRCTAGKLTIGVGRNLDDRGITEDEAMYLLNNDIDICIEACDEIFGKAFKDFSENRQNALIDLVFNLGKAGFKKFRHTIAAIQSGDWEKAARNLEKSLWFKQVKARGPRIVKMVREG